MKDAEEGVPMDIFLIGDEGVGKSLLITEFVEGEINEIENENAVRFGSRVENVNQLDIRFKIHNCTSTEEFMKIKDEECPNVKSPLIVIVCDEDKPDSFESLKTKWINFSNEDITELFLDTGVGKSSFNIMSQGEISRILSSSPIERRFVVIIPIFIN